MVRKAIYIMMLAAASPALGNSLNLSNYQLAGTHALPAIAASEASAITWNWDTDTLFVLGDEGDAIAEVSKTGVQLSVMTLTGFADTEGLSYIGNGRFVITEERLQDAYRLTYTAGGTVALSSLPTLSLGPTVGNIGIEGIALDRVSGKFITVKEKTPQGVMEATLNFDAVTVSTSDLFVPNLGVDDLSDVQTLSAVPHLVGGPDAQNLLIFSQESALLMEVSRTGQVLSQFSFAGIVDNAEGVTIDSNGIIYVVGENPTLYVLTPEPTSLLMLGAGVAGLMFRRRRSFQAV